MRIFPAAFLAEMNKKTGAAPVWILKLTVGGSDYYLSDSAFTVDGWDGGPTTLPWVASWGRLTEGLQNSLNEILVADFDAELLVDLDSSPNMADLATASDLERSPASLYLWFRGLDAATAPPQEMFRAYVYDVSLPDETSVHLVLQDETLRLRGYVGAKVSRADYPSADPDDVGKVIPIPFGTVKRLPALAVDAGVQTSLPNNVNATTTSVPVSDTAGLSVGMVLQIDDEQLEIDAIAGDSLTVTRGVNTTIAATHLKGAIAWQVKTEFAYLVADCPVDSIDKIFGVVGQAEVDITAIATAYTGQSGDEHAGYPGLAVVTLPGYITVSQAVDLLLNDGITVQDTLGILDTLGIDDGIGVDDLLTILNTLGVSDGLTVVNSLGIGDTLTINDTIGIDDLLTILDGITVNNGLSLLDTLSVSDLMTIVDTLGVSNNTLSVSDTISVSNGTLAVGDNISVNDPGHTHGGSTLIAYVPLQEAVVTAGSVSFPNNLIDGQFETVESLHTTDDVRCTRVTSFSQGGNPIRYRGAVRYGGAQYNYAIKYGLTSAGTTGAASSVPVTRYTGWVNINSWNDLIGKTLYLSGGTSPYSTTIRDAWLEVQYDTDTSNTDANVSKSGGAYKSGSVAKSGSASLSGTVGKTGGVSRSGNITLGGDVNLSGDVTKGGTVGRSGTIDKTGTVSRSGTIDLSGDVDRSGAIGLSGDVDRSGSVSKSGTVTKTGTVDRTGSVVKAGTVTLSGNSTANTLVGDAVLVNLTRVRTPAQACDDIIARIGSWPATILSGALPGSYAINGAITEYKPAIDWLATLAFQLRCYFRVLLGVPTLIVRPDSILSVRGVAACRQSGGRKAISRRKSDYTEIINTIDLLYDRDWSQSAGAEAYRQAASDSDADSITDYGVQERPELFRFDFVTGQTMAESLRDFYLAQYKRRAWIFEAELYIDQADLQFADGVTLGFLAGETAELQQVKLSPGDYQTMDVVRVIGRG